MTQGNTVWRAANDIDTHVYFKTGRARNPVSDAFHPETT